MDKKKNFIRVVCLQLISKCNSKIANFGSKGLLWYAFVTISSTTITKKKFLVKKKNDNFILA